MYLMPMNYYNFERRQENSLFLHYKTKSITFKPTQKENCFKKFTCCFFKSLSDDNNSDVKM